MKKIFILCLICLFLIPSVSGFKISDFEEKKVYYTQVIEKKLSHKLDKLSKIKLNKLLVKVEKFIDKIDLDTSLSDNRKMVKLSLLYALKDILDTKIIDYKEAIKVTVIDDKRCTGCQTNGLISQLKQIPALKSVDFELKDFSDEGVKEYLVDNNIMVLPVVLFNTNLVEPGVNPYLNQIVSWEYSLQVWASFDPFKIRSNKWYLQLDIQKIEEIKKGAYIKWNKNAKITWIEYSDLECPFCAKLHNTGTAEDLEEKYGDKINIMFQHFPLTQIHKNAQKWAEILECVWEEKWTDIFYSLMKLAFSEQNSTEDFLVKEAVKLWINELSLNSCITKGDYTDKVTLQMSMWQSLFWITWTPWNVIINNDTWEYEIISWAYPTQYFEKVIDDLLK